MTGIQILCLETNKRMRKKQSQIKLAEKINIATLEMQIAVLRLTLKSREGDHNTDIQKRIY